MLALLTDIDADLFSEILLFKLPQYICQVCYLQVAVKIYTVQTTDRRPCALSVVSFIFTHISNDSPELSGLAENTEGVIKCCWGKHSKIQIMTG